MRDVPKLYFGLIIAFIVSFGSVFVQQAGFMPFAIVCGSMVAGLLAWRWTNWRHPADPKRLLPIYLITAAMLMLHLWEEYVFDFAPRIAELNGTTWSGAEFLFMILFVLPSVWIIGAIGIYFRNPLGNYVAWLIFVGMIFGEPAHILVFPIKAAGPYDYFPGMWTALFPLVTALWGIHVILDDLKRQRAAEGAV